MRIEDSRAYVVVVFAGVILALSPFLPWIKAYDERSESLVHVANASTDQRYIPWVIVVYGLAAAVGVTRRTIAAYVIVLVSSAVMVAIAFFGVFTAESQAYPGDSTTLVGTYVGFGALGVILLAALVALLRL